MWFWALVGCALVIWLVISPFVVLAMRARVRRLEVRLDRLDQVLKDARPGEDQPTRQEPARGTPKASAEDPIWAPEIRPSRVPEPAATVPEAKGTQPAGTETPTPRIPTPRTPRNESREEKVSRDAVAASSILVWVGGVALALGGIFLVRWAIDEGLISPLLRVVLGGLLGAGLMAAGWSGRDWVAARIAHPIGVRTIPPTLFGAGLVILFGSIWSAHVLFGFIGPVIAFTLLAAVSYTGVLASLRLGAAIAVIGMLGAYAVPLMVQAENPNPLTLLSYVGVVTLGILAILRLSGRVWLAWGALGGYGFWTVLAGLGPLPRSSDVGTLIVAGLYGIGGLAMFSLLLPGAKEGSEPNKSGAPRSRAGLVRWTSPLLAAGLSAFLIYLVVSTNEFGSVSLLIVAAYLGAALYLSLGDGRAVPSLLAVIGLLAVLIGTWPPMQPSTPLEPDIPLHSWFSIQTLTMVFVAIFVTTAYLAWRRHEDGDPIGFTTVFWPITVSAATLVLPATAFAANAGMRPALGLAFIVALAGVGLADLAQRYGQKSSGPHTDRIADFYVAGAASALALGVFMLLDEVWLTISLAAELPVLAWLYTRTRIRGAEIMTLALGILVGYRILVVDNLITIPVNADFPLWNGMWIGIGLPAVFVWIAGWIYRSVERRLLADVFDVGSMFLLVFLLAGQVRALVLDGAMDAPNYSFLERAWNSVIWLSLAFFLYVRQGSTIRQPLFSVITVLVVAAAVQTVLGQVLQPPFALSIGVLPIFNVLGLAYLAPGLFCFAFAIEGMRKESPYDLAPARWVGAAGLGLVLLWLTWEVRRAFHGNDLAGDGWPEGLELYTYSLVWLAFATALLVGGIRFAHTLLRQAGFVVLTGTVAKVFLVDMAVLDGIWRVLSFIGLGATLVGIGFIYQRTALAPAEEAPPEE